MSSVSKGLASGALIAAIAIAAFAMLRDRTTAPPPPHVIVLPPMDVTSAKAPHADDELWVCAGASNLPFSDAQERGFENRLARLVANGLGRRLRYEWQAPLAAARRSALANGDCDLIVGVLTSVEADEQTMTAPYYRSSYVFVTRADRPAVRSFDDPRLRRMKIGIQLNGDEESPPARALARRALAAQARGYVAGNGVADAMASRKPVDAVAEGELDTAALWGPVAGYYAALQPIPLSLTPVAGGADADHLPFAFDIAMAVRPGNTALLEQVNQVLRDRRADVSAILREYHVPLAPAGANLGRGDDTGGGMP